MSSPGTSLSPLSPKNAIASSFEPMRPVIQL
jgi:hypothetical protein